MSEIDFDKDMTMPFDGVQTNWTYEKLKQAQANGELDVVVDYTDDGIQMEVHTPYIPDWQEKGYFVAQALKFYKNYEPEVIVLSTRLYKPDAPPEESTKAIIRYGERDNFERNIPECNCANALLEAERFIFGGRK